MLSERHQWIFTARKRSLGQGNVFTSVCHSVHGGVVCLSMHHRSHDRGVCQGGVSGVSLSGGVSVWDVSVWGSVSGGLCQGDPPYRQRPPVR